MPFETPQNGGFLVAAYVVAATRVLEARALRGLYP